MIEVKKRIVEKYPHIHFGVLVIKNFSPDETVDFIYFKDSEIRKIKNKYTDYERKTFKQSEPVCHYVNYYKKFKKTYHVLHQLESIILKGKTIPNTLPLIQAMFLAEVKHILLTGGYDLDKMEQPFSFDIAEGGEKYTGVSGREIELTNNDIYLRDAKGIVMSIIYGQDDRTRITENTNNAMFVIEGVNGITKEQLINELYDLLKYLRFFDSAIEPAYMKVL